MVTVGTSGTLGTTALSGTSGTSKDTRCPRCGHPGVHEARDDGPCDGCDLCWAEAQRHERPPHHAGKERGL